MATVDRTGRSGSQRRRLCSNEVSPWHFGRSNPEPAAERIDPLYVDAPGAL